MCHCSLHFVARGVGKAHGNKAVDQARSSGIGLCLTLYLSFNSLSTKLAEDYECRSIRCKTERADMFSAFLFWASSRIYSNLSLRWDHPTDWKEAGMVHCLQVIRSTGSWATRAAVGSIESFYKQSPCRQRLTCQGLLRMDSAFWWDLRSNQRNLNDQYWK